MRENVQAIREREGGRERFLFSESSLSMKLTVPTPITLFFFCFGTDTYHGTEQMLRKPVQGVYRGTCCDLRQAVRVLFLFLFFFGYAGDLFLTFFFEDIPTFHTRLTPPPPPFPPSLQFSPTTMAQTTILNPLNISLYSAACCMYHM